MAVTICVSFKRAFLLNLLFNPCCIFALTSAAEEEETAAASQEGGQDVENEETTPGSCMILGNASLCYDGCNARMYACV